MCKFICKKCGSNKLGYQKYIKCITPAHIHPDSHIEYELSTFEENDYLATENGFICLNCNTLVEHCGCRMIDEDDVVDYLRIPPVDRDRDQQEYDEFEILSSNEEDEKPAGIE
ncbi:MAG: hypothetical protein ACYC54_07765 [Sedimentisphaerales bacterium]